MQQITLADHSIIIKGKVSFANVVAIYKELCAAIAKLSPGAVSVNLSELDCVDSAVLPCLTLARNFALEKNIEINYVSCPSKLEQLVAICGLDYLISPGSINA